MLGTLRRVFLHLVVGKLSVVGVYTYSFLRRSQVKEFLEVPRWSRVVDRVTYIVDTAAAITIVWRFDIVSAHRLCLRADGLVRKGCTVGLLAVLILVETAVDHITCKCHIVVYCIIYRFDAVCIVVCKDRVIGRLYVFVDDRIDEKKGGEGEVFAGS